MVSGTSLLHSLQSGSGRFFFGGVGAGGWVMLYRITRHPGIPPVCYPLPTGDENTVNISCGEQLSASVAVEVVDEFLLSFQLRNIDFRMRLQANEGRTITYHLRPTRRGFTLSDGFRVFVAGRMGLLSADILRCCRWMSSRYIRPI